MKTFRDYLTESTKIYSFKVKVAGDVPENFEENLKKSLDNHKVVSLNKMSAVQEAAIDFPQNASREITVFDLVLEYPITAPEITAYIKEQGLAEECFRVRGSSEPSELDHLAVDKKTGKAILVDPSYSEAIKLKPKDYFGDDFNRDFLKTLAKEAKERKKELGQDKGDPDVLNSAPKIKQDKAGAKSAIGS
jgi:hypothetical protein